MFDLVLIAPEVVSMRDVLRCPRRNLDRAQVSMYRRNCRWIPGRTGAECCGYGADGWNKVFSDSQRALHLVRGCQLHAVLISL